MKNFLELIKEKVVIFDGAFGTMLEASGVKTGTVPETLVLTNPEPVKAIHRAYAEAGADVISTDTFGANIIKAGEKSDEIIRAAVKLARESAEGKYIALDLGPTGQMAEPVGTMTFEQAYDAYARAVKAGSEADVILIETMSDLTELRAALLAAKENSSLPVIASMTFDENMRTFTGVSVECYALAATPLADVVGVNCSLGPKQLLPVVKKLLASTYKPVIVQANAGLPDPEGRYSVGAEEFASYCLEYAEAGVSVIGGCCGTTPAHIAEIKKVIGARKPAPHVCELKYAVSSATRCVRIDGVKTIGERINPTGKKAMKAALLAGDLDYVTKQAVEQTEAGADILDVNAGLPGIDEKKVLTDLIKHVSKITDLPLQIDSSDPAALESALRAYSGKAIVNSVNGEDGSLDSILPLVKKYGSAVIGLTIDEKGIPKTVEGRIQIAEKIIARAKAYGIPEEDVYIDCLTLTVAAEQAQAKNTLEAIRRIKAAHPVKTVLGVSNVSFGLPARTAVNAAFLAAAMWAGLDLAIVNPNIAEIREAIDAYKVLSGEDVNCAAYSAKYAVTEAVAAVRGSAKDENASSGDVVYCIRKGLPEAGKAAAKLLDGGVAPLELVNEYLIPALNAVGADYESGKVFLPQLISAADAAKLCFDEVRSRMSADNAINRGTIALATVKGDVHDIGKNIVRTVLENYGYEIIDLGKNVEPQAVAETVKARKIKLCGLSALMTTTVKNMEETVRLLNRECPYCAVMVGGAVLTEDYARDIGADYYCKDASADVKIAKEIFEGEPSGIARLNRRSD